MISRLIRLTYYSLFLLTPLIVLPTTSELFELNKMIYIYGASLLIGFLWILDMTRRGVVHIARTPLDIPLGALLLTSAISTMFSIDIHTSIFGYYGRFNGGLISLLSYTVLFYAAVTYLNRHHVRRVLFVGLVSTFIVVLLGIPAKFNADALCYILAGIPSNACWTNQFRPAERMFSTLGQPNWLGAYLAVMFFIALYFFVRELSYGKKMRPRLLITIIAYSALAFAAILFTRSRSSMIAVFSAGVLYAGYVFFFLPQITKKVLSHAKIITTVATLFVVMLLFIKTGVPAIDKYMSLAPFTSQQEQVEQEGDDIGGIDAPQQAVQVGSGVTDSFTIRTIVWEGAWNAFLKRPIVGYGPETFALAYYGTRPIVHNLTSEWDFIYNKAHNEYLNYLATGGVLVSAAYAAFVLGVLYLGLSAMFSALFGMRPAQKGTDLLLVSAFIASFITILITNFFGFSISIIQLYFFGLAAWIVIELGASQVPSPRKNHQVLKKHYAYVGVVAIFVIVGARYLVTFYIADTLYARGSSQLAAGEYQQAASSLARAVDLVPDEHVYAEKFSTALAQMALASSFTPESAVAKDELIELTDVFQRRMLAASSNNPLYLRTAAKNDYILYQVDLDPSYVTSSLSHFERARALAPTDPRIPYSISLMYSLLAGEQEEPARLQQLQQQALSSIDQAIKLKPDYVDAYVLRVKLLSSFGQQEAADLARLEFLEFFPSISTQEAQQLFGELE